MLSRWRKTLFLSPGYSILSRFCYIPFRSMSNFIYNNFLAGMTHHINFSLTKNEICLCIKKRKSNWHHLDGSKAFFSFFLKNFPFASCWAFHSSPCCSSNKIRLSKMGRSSRLQFEKRDSDFYYLNGSIYQSINCRNGIKRGKTIQPIFPFNILSSHSEIFISVFKGNDIKRLFLSHKHQRSLHPSNFNRMLANFLSFFSDFSTLAFYY